MTDNETLIEGVEIASSLELNSLMTASKDAIQSKVQLALSNVHEGNIDAVEALIYAKKGLELFTALEKNVRPYAEAKQLEKGYTAYNVQFTQRAGAAKPDYSTCGDSTWNELQKDLVKLKEKIADRETFLKSLKEPVANMDGEVINPPVVTYGKMGYALTII